MAERRMFAKATIGSARFLRMPSTSRLLYYDLGMQADDDGIVEAFAVMRTTGATEDDLRVLASKGFVRVLNEDLVAYITDWNQNNSIKRDRYRPSVYRDLLVQLKSGTILEPEWNQNGTQVEPQVSIGKDRLGKDTENTSVFSCAEPETVSTPPVIFLPLNDGKEYGVTEEQCKEWMGLYPAVDVLQQLRSMRGWLLSNPTKRKTSRGVLRFVTGWLSKEQDRGRTRTGTNAGKGRSIPTDTDYMEGWNIMKDVLESIIERGYKGMDPSTVYMGEDGLLHCLKCRQPVERFISVLGRKVMVECACDKTAEGKQARVSSRMTVERKLRENSLYDPGYDAYTFDLDSSPDSAASKLCRAYVDHWTEMEKGNYGLLFTGGLGTGKSFLAAATINAVRRRGVPAIIVSTSRLVNTIQAATDPQRVLDQLNEFSLVALDDLGAERNTSFAQEQIEAFINSRSLRRKPLIVTTNMTRRDLDNPDNLTYGRIFDRVMELCCLPVILTGNSRRVERAKARAAKCKELLGV